MPACSGNIPSFPIVVPHMNRILETERLFLRELNLTDAGFILALLNSEPWLRYIGDRGVKNIQQAEKYLLEGPMTSYRVNGFGLYLVTLKSGIPVGVCGLLRRDTMPHPDIGFAFLPAFSGKGYGFEIARATMEYAKSDLGLATILAITTPDNTPSINLLKKIGMHFEKSVLFKDSNEEMLMFST